MLARGMRLNCLARRGDALLVGDIHRGRICLEKSQCPPASLWLPLASFGYPILVHHSPVQGVPCYLQWPPSLPAQRRPEGDKLLHGLKNNMAEQFSIGSMVDTTFWSKGRGGWILIVDYVCLFRHFLVAGLNR